MRQVKLLYRGKADRLTEKRPLDLGYDLPGPDRDVVLWPGESALINTGVVVQFPVFGRLKRWWLRLLFGIDMTGVGFLIRPRGRSDALIGSGVIDAGYRGEILIKVINPLNRPIRLEAGKPFAQMIPKLVIHMPILNAQKIDTKTERGASGGIWE